MKLGKDESKQNDKHVSTDSSLGLPQVFVPESL